MHSRTFWLGEIQDVGFLPRVPEVAVTSWQLLEVFRGQRSSLHFTFFADASRTALCSVRTDSRACISLLSHIFHILLSLKSQFSVIVSGTL